MQLAILVVYLYHDEEAGLLDIHLGRMRRHTSVPYRLYGSINRLAPEQQRRLASHAEIELCLCPPTDLRVGPEHAHYLDHLTARAVADGATHVITLHLDSFPVRDGWVEEVVSHLTGRCVVATLEEINTACLAFSREFYLDYRPAFRPGLPIWNSEPFRRYLAESGVRPHSGVGYGFAAHRAGLSSYFLRDPRPNLPRPPAAVFDDLILHVGGAVGARHLSVASTAGRVVETTSRPIATAYRRLVPLAIRAACRKRWEVVFREIIDKSRNLDYQRAVAATLVELMADPDAYVERCRRIRQDAEESGVRAS